MPPKRTTKRTKASPPSPSTSSEMDSQRLLEDEEMPEEDMQHIPTASPSSSSGGYGYNALKTHQGQIYSGMAVGGSHAWDYDPGVWKETKEEPDLWRIDYQTNKRRAKRKAPSGSGAPVGTEYHWLIVGHQVCLPLSSTDSDAHVPCHIQMVKKTDANTYETHLTGSKYKLAYKSASSNSWSVPTVKKQRDREIELLEDAKQRVQGRPPVLASERVRVAAPEKGQQKLDALFAKDGKKRKREEEKEEEATVDGDTD